MGDTRRAGQRRKQAQPDAGVLDTRGDTGLVEGDRQRQHRHTRLQGIEHGVQPGMSHHGRRLRQHGPLRCEVGDPACAFLPEPGGRCGIQPTAMGDQQLHIEPPTGPGDTAQQAVAVALQRAQRGEDERPCTVQRPLQPGRHRQRLAQRAERMEVWRQGLPRKVEAVHRLADLQQRRQTVAQARASGQAERPAIALDHLGMRPHQPIVDAAAVPVELLAPVRGPVAPGHHRQRHQRLAVERQGAGDGNEWQPEVLGQQRTGRLHLVGQHRLHFQRPQHGRRLAAEQLGARRHVGDHPANAERSGAGGTTHHRGQRARRMGVATDGGEARRG